jgi:adenosine deaminase
MDNVRYIELRFTPAALSKVEDFPLGEVMDWVIAGVNQAKSELNISVSLIVSVNRHESVALAEKVVDLAIERLPLGITGIDLAGDEVRYPAKPFASIIKEARQGGLHCWVLSGSDMAFVF